MSKSSYVIEDWRDTLRAARAADSKEPLYRLARPILNILARRHLTAKTLRRYCPSLVIQERGLPLVARRRWAARGASLEGKTVLVQGTGSGWDVMTWAEFRPRRIVAVDLFAFDQWAEVTREVGQLYGVPVEFHVAPLDDLPFVNSGSIDLCASDAVFEHVRELPAVMDETRRVLAPHGRVYASYGPLWYTAGGDHFARGGLANVFNHLLLDDEEYADYIRSWTRTTESMQSGQRYLTLELFSRLRSIEYLEVFERAGFLMEDLVLEVSSDAIRFRQRFPGRFSELCQRHNHCTTDDFILKTHIVRLKAGPPVDR